MSEENEPPYCLHCEENDSYYRHLAECRRLVLGFFDNDMKKTDLWFKTENPLLGNRSPDQMLYVDRGWKLLKFIQNQLEGNNP